MWISIIIVGLVGFSLFYWVFDGLRAYIGEL